MSALEQLQGGFAFAHAAVTHEQQPLAVNLHQNAVAGDTGCQGRTQIGNDVGGQRGSGLTGAQNGDAVLSCHFQALGVYGKVPGI